MDPEPYFEITRTVFDLPVDMQNFLYYFEKKKMQISMKYFNFNRQNTNKWQMN